MALRYLLVVEPVSIWWLEVKWICPKRRFQRPVKISPLGTKPRKTWRHQIDGTNLFWEGYQQKFETCHSKSALAYWSYWLPGLCSCRPFNMTPSSSVRRSTRYFITRNSLVSPDFLSKKKVPNSFLRFKKDRPRHSIHAGNNDGKTQGFHSSFTFCWQNLALFVAVHHCSSQWISSAQARLRTWIPV